MWEAVHGKWCGTKTYPTQCASCGGSVFFFQCNHGSKVFFDELGPPWPIHDCDTSWTRDLERNVTEEGEIEVEVRPGIFVIRSSDASTSFGIERSIVAKARAAKKKQVFDDPIVAIEPERVLSESHIGVLREVRRSVDPIKAYKKRNTDIGYAMLGRIGKQDVGKITVHVPYPEDDQAESFTSWIPARLLQNRRITRGVTVAFDVETVNVSGYGYTWFCDSLEVLE